jgi:hypothetical protein
MLSGFAGKVRSGVFSTTEFTTLRSQFLGDVKRRMLRPVRIINAHYQHAGALISQHGMSRQLRALDAIQLAVALRIHQTAPIDHFVCADQRLCDIAVLEGLAVLNPEHP